MPTLTEFAQNLRSKLSVDDSYDADIELSVRRYVTKLLRDYNFPKSIRIQTWMAIAAGEQAYTAPSDMKRALQLQFFDTSDATETKYGDPLLKREGFVRGDADLTPRYWWLAGGEIWVDIAVPVDSPNTNLALTYQSNSVAHNLSWMLDEFEDILFSLSMFRLASEMGKPEVMQIWAAIWTEDQRSLAIYLNELEWSGADLRFRETVAARGERYPAGGPA